MNRCLTEGRRSFLRRVERIETGAECERLAPLLSALADGEATARDMAMLRPHLRSCLSCRAALRDAREVPARVAALAPIGLLAGSGMHPGGGAGGWLGAAFRSAGDWLNERMAALALRSQELLETASSHKLAAAAASAAALGGGGIATVQVSGQHGSDGGGGHHRPTPTVVASHGAAVVPRWRPASAAVVPAAKREARAPRAPDGHRHRGQPSRDEASPRQVLPAEPQAPAPRSRTEPAPGSSAPGAIEPATTGEAPESGSKTPQPSGGEAGEFGP